MPFSDSDPHNGGQLSSARAAGDTKPTLFVFKGSQEPYLQVLVNGDVEQQTYVGMLPRGSVVEMR